MVPMNLAAVAAVIALAVGAASGAYWNGNRWEVKCQTLQLEAQRYELDVALARAEGLRAGIAAASEDMRRIQETANARIKEVEAIAKRTDEQRRGVLRLCNRPARPVPAPAAGGGTHAATEPAAPTGLVSGSVDDAGAVFDPEIIRERLNRAELVAADLRACMAAWPQ